eukprot:NODE_187_length_2999_cov_13.394298_g173_i0.p1 GENE.NODE_187_length_2999_cov_13.394298_g173_i0~~NODE_187_length_2999_cov_13.394298_g173_i0.p1  ORF type:complete len:809 (+),score=89.36 NODE_187_length_2999_cov_13.394298_g173_i0:36-2462(+)
MCYKCIAARLYAEACGNNHRRLLVLSGTEHWCVESASVIQHQLHAASLAPSLQTEAVVWISSLRHNAQPASDAASDAPKVEHVAPERAKSLLGRSIKLLVYNMHYNGPDPDVIGAVEGTVVGGGLLIFLTPSLDGWAEDYGCLQARLVVSPYELKDVGGRFVRRFVDHLTADANANVGWLAICQEGADAVSCISSEATPVVLPAETCPTTTTSPVVRQEEKKEEDAATSSCQESCDPSASHPLEMAPTWCRTSDQLQAVGELCSLVRPKDGSKRTKGKSQQRVVVLQADRGRGKSSSFGIAAQLMLNAQWVNSVVLVSPTEEGGKAVLRMATLLNKHNLNPDTTIRSATDIIQNHWSGHPAADLLLVDEAAALPVNVLRSLLQCAPHVAFATTLHGYEGSGRGFSVRFCAFLEKNTKCTTVRMTAPIRWAPSDPLEKWSSRLLLCHASVAAIDPTTLDPPACKVLTISKDDISRDERLLEAVFAILVLAHYDTTPADLLRLLDAPNLTTHCLMTPQGLVAAVALLAEEGGLGAQECASLITGRARAKGHMLPETLCCHVGFEQAGELRCHRVVRIAVHPELQRHGLGTILLQAVIETSRKEGKDYIGAGFGADPDVLQFWRSAGFSLVHIGSKVGNCSGVPSAVTMLPISSAAKSTIEAGMSKCRADLPHLLMESLSGLSPEGVLALFSMHNSPEEARTTLAKALAHSDWRDLCAYSFGPRIYDCVARLLWTLICGCCVDVSTFISLVEHKHASLLIMKVLQKHSWDAVTRYLQYNAVANAMRDVRRAVQPLLLHYNPPLYSPVSLEF